MKKKGPATGAGEIAKAVTGVARRRHVPYSLAEKLASQELMKGRKPDDAGKEVKGRLHQVMLSFEAGSDRMAGLAGAFKQAGADRASLLHAAGSGLMLHSSTKERMGFMAELYRFAFDGMSPGKVLDLACGLNPLALPWMGLPSDVEYLAVDASGACGEAVEAFFKSWGVNGRFLQMDLSSCFPAGRFDVALLLKALPTLDRIEEGLGMGCLERVDAGTAVVSFPTRSMGGADKGMASFYGGAFEEHASQRGWSYDRAEFPNELVYRVRK